MKIDLAAKMKNKGNEMRSLHDFAEYLMAWEVVERVCIDMYKQVHSSEKECTGNCEILRQYISIVASARLHIAALVAYVVTDYEKQGLSTEVDINEDDERLEELMVEIFERLQDATKTQGDELDVDIIPEGELN